MPPRPLLVGAYYLHELAARALVAGRDPRPALDETFDAVRQAGAIGVRTLACHVGTGATAIQSGPAEVRELGLRALDVVLDGAARSGLGLVLSLGNGWSDYGGARAVCAMAGLFRPTTNDLRFYVHPRAREVFRFGMRAVLAHRSSIDGRVLATHPAVLGWEALNEPRGGRLDRGGRALAEWIGTMSAHLAAEAPGKWVTSGEEGFDCDAVGRDAAFWRRANGAHLFRHAQSFRRNSALGALSHASIHVYPQAWHIREACVAEAGERFIRESAGLARGKPLFVGEMGAVGPNRLEHLARWARAAWDVGGICAPWMLASRHMPAHRDKYAIEPADFVAWARELRR